MVKKIKYRAFLKNATNDLEKDFFERTHCLVKQWKTSKKIQIISLPQMIQENMTQYQINVTMQHNE